MVHEVSRNLMTDETILPYYVMPYLSQQEPMSNLLAIQLFIDHLFENWKGALLETLMFIYSLFFFLDILEVLKEIDDASKRKVEIIDPFLVSGIEIRNLKNVFSLDGKWYVFVCC